MAVRDINELDEVRTPAATRRNGDYAGRTASRVIELDDEDDAQFLRTEKRVPVRRSPLPKKTQNWLKMAGAVVLMVLVSCSAVWAAYSYGLHSWRFRIRSSDDIEVTGVYNAPRAQIMDIATKDIGRNVFSVPLDERKKQLEQIPWVESASVMRLLPNRIAVSIRERTPVAFVLIGNRLSMIDSQGVVMGMPASRQNYSFPVVRGIAESEPLSSRAAALKIYNRLMGDLDSEGGHYSADLSEVDLSDPENVKVVTRDAGAVLVSLGSFDFLPRFKLYVTHQAAWRQERPDMKAVDLRYNGQAIINPDTPGTAAPQPPAPQARAAKAAKATAPKATRHRRRHR